MDFAKTTLRVLVQKDYGACYDFYTEKLGLVPIWGDRNGPTLRLRPLKESRPALPYLTRQRWKKAVFPPWRAFARTPSAA